MKTEKLLWQFNENIHQVNQDIINETGDTLMKYTTVNVGVTKHLGQNGGHAGHDAGFRGGASDQRAAPLRHFTGPFLRGCDARPTAPRAPHRGGVPYWRAGGSRLAGRRGGGAEAPISFKVP